MSYPNYCLARPAERWAFDAAMLDGEPIMTEAQAEEARANPARVTLDISRQTWEEAAKRAGGVLELVHYDEIHRRSVAHYSRPPELVTREQFWDALEVLPPCRWDMGGSREAFHVSELLTGDLANWFVRLGRGDAAEYWGLVMSCRTPLEDVYKAATEASQAAKAANPAAEA